MYNYRMVTDDLYWVGADDHRLALFENIHPLYHGVSYNAYVLMDEKTVLFDSADWAVGRQFITNVKAVLAGRSLDYMVINHVEPDHAASIEEILLRWPDVKIITTPKAVTLLNQFGFNLDPNKVDVVKEGDTRCFGRHTIAFLYAPMVHWPEVMVSFDTTNGVLFSADAFGSFRALDGKLFADEVNFDREWLDEARRYYTNIVGKYGTQVQALLKKAAGIEIETICPLHGPVWRKNIGWFIEKYQLWSSYQPEEQAVMIAYASVYGNTENAAEIIAARLSEQGVKNIAMYDVSVTHPSVIVSEAFRCSHLIFASTTYNAGIFVTMETVMHDLWAHNLQNRTVALVENGTWAATSGKLMKEILASLKNMTILENTVSLRSSVKDAQREQLIALADAVAASLHPAKDEKAENAANPAIEPSAMFKLSYGLFVLSAKEGGRDNGCIINTVQQVTDNPKRISIAVNKANFTHDMIKSTGVFNVSVLSQDAPFKTFQQYGFQSGRDADKFAGQPVARTANGLVYLTENTNAVLSAKVIKTVEYETHTVFFADVTEAKVLSDVPSMTYDYYFAHVKPKPQPVQADKKGWVCKICGYVYEGEELPADFVCPLCKHGPEDFEPLK